MATLIEIRCRECPVSRRLKPSDARRLVSYDSTTATYLCKRCTGQTYARLVKLRCRRCGKTSERRPSEAKARGNGQYRTNTKVQTIDGQLSHLCRQCAGDTLGVEGFRKGRQRLLAKWGISNADDDETRRDVMRAQMDLAVRAAGGYAGLRKLASGARTTAGVRRWSLSRIANGTRRAGEFRLCPACNKVVYRPAGRLKGSAEKPPALGFHGACWRQWRQSPEYRAWCKRMAGLRQRRMQRRRDPLPLPPSLQGRPPAPAELDRHFRWVLRHYGLRESWRQIAARATPTGGSYSHVAVMKGARSFLNQLPATWAEVWGGKQPGARLDKLLPISSLHAMASTADQVRVSLPPPQAI